MEKQNFLPFDCRTVFLLLNRYFLLRFLSFSNSEQNSIGTWELNKGEWLEWKTTYAAWKEFPFIIRWKLFFLYELPVECRLLLLFYPLRLSRIFDELSLVVAYVLFLTELLKGNVYEFFPPRFLRYLFMSFLGAAFITKFDQKLCWKVLFEDFFLKKTFVNSAEVKLFFWTFRI